MRKRELTEFGVAVKKKLWENGKTQEELITEVRELTGQYCDNSLTYKLFTGQIQRPAIEQAIRDILEL